MRVRMSFQGGIQEKSMGPNEISQGECKNSYINATSKKGDLYGDVFLNEV